MYLRPKKVEFCFQNLVNNREDENGCRLTTFGYNI